MAWVKLDDRFFQHPKIVRLSSHAFRLYVNSLCYASLYQTDGKIVANVWQMLSSGFHNPSLDDTHPDNWVQELVAAGLWEKAEFEQGTYRIHDFLDYNMSKEERERLTEIRVKSGQLGGMAKRKQDAKQKRSKPQRSKNLANDGTHQTQTQTQTPLDRKKKKNSVGSDDPTAFALLWEIYPIPKGPKQDALKAFREVQPPENVVELLKAQIAHKSACDSRGEFCPQLPHVHRWLKHLRWTDEIPQNGNTPLLPVDLKAQWKNREAYLVARKAGRVNPKERVPEWEA